MQGVIHNVRAPVEQLSAAKLLDGLPVVAALIAVTGKTDLINLAENAGIDDLVDLQKSFLKAAIVANEHLGTAGLTAKTNQLLCLLVGFTEWLFHQNAFACQKRHFCMGVVIAGTGGDIYQLHLGIGDHILDILISTATKLLGKHIGSFGDQITGGNHLKLIGAILEAILVTEHTDTAKSYGTDLDGF